MQGVVLQAVVGCTLGGLLWMGVALRRWGQGFAWEGGCMKVRLSQVGVCCRSLLVLLGGGGGCSWERQVLDQPTPLPLPLGPTSWAVGLLGLGGAAQHWEPCAWEGGA